MLKNAHFEPNREKKGDCDDLLLYETGDLEFKVNGGRGIAWLTDRHRSGLVFYSPHCPIQLLSNLRMLLMDHLQMMSTKMN